MWECISILSTLYSTWRAMAKAWQGLYIWRVERVVQQVPYSRHLSLLLIVAAIYLAI